MGERSALPAHEPIEFVADLIGDLEIPQPELRTVSDPGVVAELISAESYARVGAVLEHFGRTPVILLSGGVDSIHVAAVAVRLGYRPHAITVVTDGQSDAVNATAAAEALGLPHTIVRLSPDEVVELARVTIPRLGTAELWEVTAAVPMLAVRRVLEEIGDVGAILTGGGADVILAGGCTLTAPLESDAARAELDELVRSEAAVNFRRERLVTHFYPALLEGFADRMVQPFQTVRWWRLAETFAPPALFGEHDGRSVDKLALRMACAAQLPPGAGSLAWAPKVAIQRSSGLLGVLAQAARSYAAGLPGARTYTDPLTEDPEAVATRLYLEILRRS